MKKIILPMIYVGEWVLFFYVLIFVFVFNMIYYTNMILIDMPWEEQIILPVIKVVLTVIGIGIMCYLYIKYLTGKSVYKKIKEVIWGILFGANTLFCIIWLYLSYPFGLSNVERISLIIAIFVSAILTIQVIKKYRDEGRK